MGYIICHYAEIGIKGKNRKMFEEALVKNIKLGLKKYAPGSFFGVQRIPGAILITLTKMGITARELVDSVLQHTFGLAYFAHAAVVSPDIEKIKRAVTELLIEKNFQTFKIDARRSDKQFQKSSREINEILGTAVVEKFGKKVKLDGPDVTCFIEVTDKHAFIYTKKIAGPGGLPVGASGKTLVMLSGGIDSSVASYYAMKRGSPVEYIHFHSLPYTSPASVEKAKELIQILTKFQPQGAVLYLVPFYPIQKEIMLHTPARYRVVLYRRFMFKIAEVIAQKIRAHALNTGESLGQVASQTIENIATIGDSIKMPVLRPLIGFDKQEIVNKAKEIGTYEPSILPHEDCCSLFLPSSPATKSNVEEIRKLEARLPQEKIFERALNAVQCEEV